MTAALKTRFTIDGPNLHLAQIDLQTDGASTQLVGDVDVAHWPEQRYELESHVQFPIMRELFFADDDFELSGEGRFVGSYHIYEGGRDLEGDFTSEVAGLDDLRFPDLRGSLIWRRDRFEVTEATSGFSGGRTRLSYAIGPLDDVRPAVARFDAAYDGVDLEALSQVVAMPRLQGRATGHNLLEWPLGRWSEHRGRGHLEVEPGVEVLRSRGITPARRGLAEGYGGAGGPFTAPETLDGLAFGGLLDYAYGPEWVDLEPAWFATGRTYVEFQGRTAYGERSQIPFHVTSLDWQESDRLLAGIITAFGSPTHAVPIAGYGEFEGVMSGTFRRPSIVGRFRGQRMFAWDVEWGSAQAEVTIENAYVDVRSGLIASDTSEIEIDGRFSIGSPRSDGGDEIDARIRINDWPLVELRHAFGLDRYRVEGLVTGDYHLYGEYRHPFGFGTMAIADVLAYGEQLDSATAELRLEGEGVRFDAVEIQKGGGVITGAAFVGFDGTYSFNADGRRFPVESLAMAQQADAPLSGLLEFTASGSAEFEAPRYDVRGTIDDLFVRDEGIGQLTALLGVRGDLLTFEVGAASPRLTVTGSGQVALTPEADAELTFRFSDTSLDPYARAFRPGLSPFTTAIASGTVRVVGSLQDWQHLLVDGTIEELRIDLFDYGIANDGPIRLVANQGIVQVRQLGLVGDGTELQLAGELNLEEDALAIQATGDASLGILQGLFPDVRSSGEATLSAEIRGSMGEPRLTGSAAVTDGRIRHFSVPHSLDALNGRVTFDENGIRLDGLRGRVAGGEVQFGGWIGLEGFLPGELSVTATGAEMRLRYPAGVRSVVDADLALRGEVSDPLLSGTVRVRSAIWTERFDAGGMSVFGVGEEAAPPVADAAPALPVRFDVQVLAPSTLQIENNTARIVASADLTLRGSLARPLLFGRVEIDRGEVLFEGHRYVVTRGSIDFSNPTRIEPFFDVEAETRVRVPGETYRVVFRAVGTAERFVPDVSSDPPLPTVDVLALLFGDPQDPRNADLRALSSPDLAEQELLQARAARLLASPISSGVGRLVEEAFGVDSVQISPSLSDPTAQQSASLNPSARLTIGKRISDRIYLTFSRALAASTSDQILLLEYDQNERLAWIVSQNEDRSYALDFRVRHVF
jgi:translocation and assembly module TamB